MVLIGILSTLAVSRFAGRQPYDEFGYLNELATAARYAQKLAVATRCPVRLTLTAPGAYRLAQPDSYAAGSCATNFAAEVVDPATNTRPYAGSAPSGVGVSVSGGFPQQRDFDAQGGITPDSDLIVQVGARSVRLRAGSGLVSLE